MYNEEADRLARKESKNLKYRDCEVKKSPKIEGTLSFIDWVEYYGNNSFRYKNNKSYSSR